MPPPSAGPMPESSSSRHRQSSPAAATVPFEWEAPDWPDLEDDMNDFDIDPSEDIERDEFLLLPPQIPLQPRSHQESSKANTHRSLDDDDDARVEDPHPTAGKIIGHAPSTVPKDQDGDTVMHDLDHGSPFLPFCSELDWCFAEWAVKDGPGQKAMDRLLAIPGVHHLSLCFITSTTYKRLKFLQIKEKLGLSFNNMRALLQKVDSIPDRAGEWQTKELFFRDHGDEKYTIRFRDPIEAIKSLFADPTLEKH